MATARISWSDLSEIVAGKLIKGEISPNAVRPDALIEPYDVLPKLLKRSGGRSNDRLIEKIGIAAFKASTEAAKATRGLPQDWPALLERAAARYEGGAELEKFARRLQDGEDVDTTRIFSVLHRSLAQERRRVINLADAKPDKTPIKPTGLSFLDDHFGGLPTPGLTTVGAPPGTGKTTFAIALSAAMARRKKKTVLFSMEMTASQISLRYLEAGNLRAADRKYIDLIEDILRPDEVGAITSRIEDAALIVIDFAELLLLGDSEQSEQRMAQVYVTLANLAKQLNLPVVLLAQLNRASYNSGNIPSLSSYRYSGLAEAMSSAAMLIHNPTAVYIASDADAVLPPEHGKAYLIIAKSRFGFGHGKFKHFGPGAIQVAWENERGWQDESKWFDLAHAGDGGYARPNNGRGTR